MPKKVLLVDDEPNLLLPLRYLLAEAGHEVHTAANGKEALQIIGELHPDVVLLDVFMPLLNGYEVCESIRAVEEWRDIHIIMVSAEGRRSAQEKALQLGADAFLVKPFATAELLQKIETLSAA